MCARYEFRKRAVLRFANSRSSDVRVQCSQSLVNDLTTASNRGLNFKSVATRESMTIPLAVKEFNANDHLSPDEEVS